MTPLVRKLAAEHGVDLAALTGTGVGGRIRKQDVLEAAERKRPRKPPRPAARLLPGGAPAARPRRAAPGSPRTGGSGAAWHAPSR